MLISLLMLSGVLLITRPPFLFHSASGQHDDSNLFSPIGYMCAVLVPLLSAIISILTRQLKDIHASIVLFWFASGTFIIGCGGLSFVMLQRDRLINNYHHTRAPGDKVVQSVLPQPGRLSLLLSYHHTGYLGKPLIHICCQVNILLMYVSMCNMAPSTRAN